MRKILSRTPAPNTGTARPLLGLSTAIAYLIGIALLALVVDFVGIIELTAQLRILDDLANMGLVQVTDADEVASPGLIFADPLAYELARTPIQLKVAAVAFLLVLTAMVLRGFRYRLIAQQAGCDDATSGLADSYFLGLGTNLLLPYGPGEYVSAKTLAENGADPEAALAPAYYGRIFEVLALATGILGGFLALGWRGTFIPIVVTFAVLVVLTALVRPMGQRSGADAPARGRARRFLDWMNVSEIGRGIRQYFGAYPNHAVAVYLLSVVAIVVEVSGLWFMKQAFSNQFTGQYLLINITFPEFALVVAVASLTRVIPITPGAIGVYEGLTVVLFHFVFGAIALSAVAVAILDSVLTAAVTLLLFAYARYRKGIAVRDAWQEFVRFSRTRTAGGGPLDAETAFGSDAD